MRYIDGDDAEARMALFDLTLSKDSNDAQCSDMLFIGCSYDLKGAKWGLPCVKCEYLFRGMYGWNPSGLKTTRYLNFSPMRCAESLALALAHDTWKDTR
jgi:hypothetical protein